MNEEILAELEKMDLNSNIIQEEAVTFEKRYKGTNWERFASGAIDEKKQENRYFYLGALFIIQALTSLCSTAIQEISKILDQAILKPPVLRELQWSRIQFGISHELLDSYVAYKIFFSNIECSPVRQITKEDIDARSDYFEMKFKDKEMPEVISIVINDIERRRQESKDFYRGSLRMLMTYQMLFNINTKLFLIISQGEMIDKNMQDNILRIIKTTHQHIYAIEAYLSYKIKYSKVK